MKHFLVIVLALAIAALIYISSEQNEAMAECQRTYSHDVCFDLLNN